MTTDRVKSCPLTSFISSYATFTLQTRKRWEESSQVFPAVKGFIVVSFFTSTRTLTHKGLHQNVIYYWKGPSKISERKRDREKVQEKREREGEGERVTESVGKIYIETERVREREKERERVMYSPLCMWNGSNTFQHVQHDRFCGCSSVSHLAE